MDKPELLSAVVTLILALFFLGGVYFLPTIVAGINKKNKWWLTLALNASLGWTGIVWMILLIQALTPEEKGTGKS